MTSSQNWGTPPKLLNKIKKLWPISDFDVCPYPRPDNFNGLEFEWPNFSFVNPPYDSVLEFCRKAFYESLQNKTIIMLIPANRSHRKYFHKYVLPWAHIIYIEGAIPFIDLDNSCSCPSSYAKYPSMLIIYNPDKKTKLIKSLKY